MFLFVQQWEILKGRETDYTNFILRKHLPDMAKMGFNIIGGFHVIIGSGPRISSVSLAHEFLNLEKALERREFSEITKELHEYIYDYRNFVLKDTGRVPMEDYTIVLGTWRFNQYFNLIPGREAEYTAFLNKEYIPALMEMGIDINAEWQVAIGSGLQIHLEGITANLVDVAKAITSDEYKVLRRKLLSNYAADYSSRVLASTKRVEIAYILGEMTKSL